MNIGSLRHRVTIQAATESTDSFGAPSRTWADVATVWARVRPSTGAEKVVGQQIQAEVSHAVELRGGVAVTPANRLIFQSRILNIQSAIDPTERGATTKLLCLESLAPDADAD